MGPKIPPRVKCHPVIDLTEGIGVNGIFVTGCLQNVASFLIHANTMLPSLSHA